MPIESPLRAGDAWGFTAHPGDCEAYLQHVAAAIEQRQATTVLAHNLHSLHLYFRDPSMRAAYDGTVNMVDGMPVIWLLKLAGLTVGGAQRLTWVAFIWPLLETAAREGWPVHHIGQAAEIQQRALANIRQRVPGLAISGQSGYFDQRQGSAGSRAVIERCNDSDAKIVLLGLGSPLQERWLHHHRAQIDAPAALSCGACLEYVAGEVGTPPRWMGRAGLEWAYRLGENPRRFAGRYLLEPWGLAASLLRYQLRGHG